MVKSVTSLTRNGLRDWLIQRVSAVIVAAYIIAMVIYFVVHPNLQHHEWLLLFQNDWMRVFSLIFLISLLAHAWVGVWTIATDYIDSIRLRFLFLIVVLLVLFASLIWGVMIFWGV